MSKGKEDVGKMTPSVTDTDADDSDPEESNICERKALETETSSINETGHSSGCSQVENFPEVKEMSEESFDQEIILSLMQDCQLGDHPHGVDGIQDTVGVTDKCDNNARSSPIPKTHTSDVQTDLSDESTRGISNAGENLVQDLRSQRIIFSHDIEIPAADTRAVGVNPDQIFMTAGTTKTSLLTISSQGQVSTNAACHPSKLIRDNSASAQQPNLHQPMGPNSRPPSRVDEEAHEQIFDSYQLKAMELAEPDIVADTMELDEPSGDLSLHDQVEGDCWLNTHANSDDAPSLIRRSLLPKPEESIQLKIEDSIMNVVDPTSKASHTRLSGSSSPHDQFIATFTESELFQSQEALPRTDGTGLTKVAEETEEKSKTIAKDFAISCISESYPQDGEDDNRMTIELPQTDMHLSPHQFAQLTFDASRQGEVVEIVEKGVDAFSSYVEFPVVGSSPPRDQMEDNRGKARLAHITDAPPSPFRNSPPSLEDIPETGSVVLAPPGTIVFQHAKGEHAFLPPAFQHPGYGYQVQMPILQHTMNPQLIPTPPHGGGRRKITLRLQEDVHDSSRKSFFFRRSSRNVSSPLHSIEEAGIDRGTVTVSWFEGTSSSELQEHVRKTVIRKMNLQSDARLADLRIIDQSESPPEEIVLSPFIPDGSSFLLRFSTRSSKVESHPSISQSFNYSAPESPSAAPSPFPSSLDLSNLNAQLLSGKLNALKPPLVAQRRKSSLRNKPVSGNDTNGFSGDEDGEADVEGPMRKVDDADDSASKVSEHHEDDVMGYNPEDQIELRLRQIADLMIADRRKRRSHRVMKEKRQVIFVIANYFVLFLSFIAICAELSARSPQWLASLEKQLQNVQKCSTDQETLFECVSRGDYAGLMASLVLVLTRSAATKRFFLFGFETPKKLWAVVYESMVTAVCWGVSYIMIRRGMNPDTRSGFLRKYWKDAVYGSLAGFNAAFMKHVLKNLIPQETFEHALQERQLKILSWLPSFR